jgi:DNA adenine methylase
MVPIPHPIPYQGSKRNLARTIVEYFPDEVYRLIEPFAGSAAVSLYAARHQKAAHFILNDINKPLITLWDAIINRPDEMANRYHKLWELQQGQERKFYDIVRRRFNKSHQPHYLLYLLARCVKASVRYNANGEFNQSPDNRRKGRHPSAMKHDIQNASALLKNGVSLLSIDYTEVLKMASIEDVVYMDPPYQGVSASRDPRYVQNVLFDSFVEALHELNRRQISYLVSYDGRTGNKVFGKSLPESLNLQIIEIDAGRSSQATLLGRSDKTVESLYLSAKLVSRLDKHHFLSWSQKAHQLPLFSEPA